MAEPILVESAGGVATITINRPERMNAMDSHAHLALSEALDRIAADDTIRVVVLTGAGDKAFSAGRDLKELAADANPEIDARWRRITRLTDRFDYPKPIIARVAGVALGGGFELALACDIIVAADTACFAVPEPKRGLIPFAGGVHRLPRQLPLKTAMGYLLTGRDMSAARAYDLGLVNEVVPLDRLDAAVAGWTADILACAPLAIRAIRQAAMTGLGQPLPEAMAATYEAEERRKASSDSIEGPRAFAEKRPPRWAGQ
ncbi:enoyl-CoA hydratase-related protein [uncultured Sphingomonas sp.]|uniref:enoyl-CoA hydratase-related protein n=1 Tax=uncultured Sphingomonas sp. TaxID=158754 RepID=UPI0035CA2762